MLSEPDTDNRLLALDRAVVEAVRTRLQAGARPSPDADAIALRTLLAEGLDRRTATVVKAMLGRIDAAAGGAIVACGPVSAMLAAERYGSAVKPISEADEALNQTRIGGRAIIDLALPRPWWGRLLAMPDMQVVAALPDDANARPRALMVSMKRGGPTGDDRTFWVTDSTASEVRVTEALNQSGLAGQMLTTAGGLKLFMLAGYVQANDGRLSAAPGALKGVIGAAPAF